MKKMLLIGVFAMLATAMLGVTAADARGNHQDRHRPNQYNQHNQQNYKLKDDARFVLQRTANVLQQAQNEARNDRDSRGRRQHRQRMNGNNKFKGLGFAISLQAEACDLYQQGRYQEAIDYSLRARAVSLRVINHVKNPGRGWKNDNELQKCDIDRNALDSRERGYWDRRPSGSLQIHGREISDDAAINFRIQFNF
jgi:Na+-translocating ferredoxin:NAD+ oxidoreductase RnfG subunit